MIADCGKWILTGLLAVLLAVIPAQTAKATVTVSFPEEEDQRETCGDFKYYVREGKTACLDEYTGKAVNVKVPAKLDGYKVTTISYHAFTDCKKIKSIELPKGLISIEGLTRPNEEKGSGAFSGCTALTSIVIPDTVTEIGWGAFYGCTGLKSVTLGKNVKNIGVFTFAHCDKLTSVTIPSKVTEIENGAFYMCKKLKTVTLPNSLKKIGEKAFEGCVSLTGISIPKNVESVPYRGFFGCTGLKKVTIADGISLIERTAFKECDSLTSVKIPGSVKTIEQYAFYDCDNLKTVTLEEGIREIQAGVFANCWSLKKLRIPYSVKTIEYGITHAGVKLEVYEGTAGLKYAKQFFEEYYQEYTVLAKPKAISKAKVSSIATQTYTGKAIKPSLTVKYGSKTLKSGTDYTVKYANNKNVGVATVTITGKGSYTGTVKKTFTIRPKSTTISKIAPASKRFTIKWKKQSVQTTGYQIQYSTSSKFEAKKTETMTVRKPSEISAKVLRLKGATKYYVRIRTYKNVKVNGKSRNIFSAWSKAKTVRTKK